MRRCSEKEKVYHPCRSRQLIRRFLYPAPFQQFLVILFFLFWTPCISPAQPSYQVKHYTRTDYQAGSQNWSIESDDHGYLFVANNDGLLVFDGTGWKTYRIPGQAIVRSVYVAPDRKIYTGSYEEFGFWKMDAAGEYEYTSLSPGKPDSTFHNSEIWKIVECKGKIYFQSFSALFVYDQQSVRPVRLPGTCVFLLKARDRLFFQNIGGSLYEIAGERIVKIPGSHVLAGSEVKTILPFGSKDFLIGTTSDGLYLYDGTNVHPWENPANDKLREYQINNGLVSGDRFIFGTIVKGLFILDQQGRVLHHLHEGNALQNNTVLSLTCDPTGNLWVGLDKGIDHIFIDSPVDIYLAKGEQLGSVYTAALYGKWLYIGTNRGVFIFEEGSAGEDFVFHGFLNGSQGQVWDLKSIDGSLFCGHTTGTYLIEGDRLQSISRVSGGYSLARLHPDDPGSLIQSTYSPLVNYRKAGGAWKFAREVKGYQEPTRFIESDYFGNLWAGHSVKGLYRLKLSELSENVVSTEYYGKANGLPSDFSIGVFKVNNRVVFTTGVKLYTWDDLKKLIIPHETLNRKLQGFEAAVRIVNEGNGHFWFIRKNDLALFDLRSDEPRMVRHLFLPMYGIQMVDNYENAVPLDGKRLLICLDEGFAILNSDKVERQGKDRSELIFRRVYSMSNSGDKLLLDPTRKISQVPYSANSLSFSFVSVNSLNMNQLYQYQMTGIDDDWSEWSPSTSVTYNRLPAGEYTFLVRTMAGSGYFTEPIKMVFVVKPAWYASIIAWAIYALVAAGVTFWSRYLFRQRVIRHHERLRREDEARMVLEKQKAEQEIITLQNEKLQVTIAHKNMQLADSTMAIIRKNELLIEMKEELDRHRAKLGPDYPQRYFERLLAMINKNLSNDNDWLIFESLFDQAHENFFKRLKIAYPDLTQSDLKLCAYLKLNLSSKEIAPLLNISFRGVETRRYRLRRRLALGEEENLVEFIMQF